KNNLDTNYETMEPTKIANEKVDNELSKKEIKKQEKKRERIYKKLRGEIPELKPKKLSKKKKEDFEGFIQPNYNMYGGVEETPTPEPEQPEADQTTANPEATNTTNDESTYTETNIEGSLEEESNLE